MDNQDDDAGEVKQVATIEKELNDDLFVIKASVGIAEMKEELEKLMAMVESMLRLTAKTLQEIIADESTGWVIEVWLQQLDTTQQCYHVVYGNVSVMTETESIFLLNPGLSEQAVRYALTAQIHQLQSLCYQAAYELFDDTLDWHIQNNLILINKYMKQVVHLIDKLELHGFNPFTA